MVSWSSYQALATPCITNLNRREAVEWFSGEMHYDIYHRRTVDEGAIRALVYNDLE